MPFRKSAKESPIKLSRIHSGWTSDGGKYFILYLKISDKE